MASALGLIGLIAAPQSARAGERWPTWPSEVGRVAAPLHPAAERPSHDRERASALARLEVYATAVIEPHVVEALSDPSNQVRREALRICYLRRIESCIDPATAIYSDGIEPTLRAAALRVIGLDPSGPRLDLLLEALRDPSDPLRAQAARLVGWAPLRGEDRPRARRALLAKLSDTASTVRVQAVEAVGMLGPGEGTLAVTRLLEDPEPSVRATAARALGRLRDGKAVPSLIRALAGPNEPIVSRALVSALARLPGPAATDALLERLDDPPQGTSAMQVAEAIGDRPAPDDVLIDGLVSRLNEPNLRSPVQRALLLLGEHAAPALAEALARGLEPGLAVDVQRLLDAFAEPPAEPPAELSYPEPSDVAAWRGRLSTGDLQARFDAAVELGHRSPKWLGTAAASPMLSHIGNRSARPWHVALALTQTQAKLDGRLPWARLLGVAGDAKLSPSDRCLALLALRSAAQSDAANWIGRQLEARLDDAEPLVRACTCTIAPALGQAQLARLGLLDDDDRVRTSAVLALDPQEDLDERQRVRIHWMAQRDPSAAVRAAARWQLRPTPSEASPSSTLFVEPTPAAPWSRQRRFIEVSYPAKGPDTGADTRLWLPRLSEAGVDWAFGDGLRGAEPVPLPPPRR